MRWRAISAGAYRGVVVVGILCPVSGARQRQQLHVDVVHVGELPPLAVAAQVEVESKS